MTRLRRAQRANKKFVFGDQQKEALRRLIADLVGEEDRLYEMGRWIVNPEMIPDDMPFERSVLTAIYRCREEGLEPSRVNLLRDLKLYHSDATERFDQLISFQTFDRSVLSHAAALGNWIEKRQQQQIVELMQGIAHNNSITSYEAYQQMASLLQEIAPHSTTFRTLSDMDAHREWMEWHLRNADISASGKLIGPRLPWKNTWTLVPYINPGEVLLFYAKSKWGKTLTGVRIAEYIAYEIGGYNVLFCHFETSTKIMRSRIMARQLHIPQEVLEKGGYEDTDQNGNPCWVPVRLDQEPWKEMAEKENKRLERSSQNGYLAFHHCNGASINDLRLEIRKHMNASMAQGRKLVVIVDYFQKINWTGFASEETQGLNLAAHAFKKMCEDLNREPGFEDSFYAIMLAQDDPMSKEHEEEVTTRAAKEPGRVFQTAVRLWRERVKDDDANGDLPLMLNAKEQRRDSLGAPMFWHRAGEWNSLTKLQVVLSNNGATGECHLRIVNKYFMVTSA